MAHLFDVCLRGMEVRKVRLDPFISAEILSLSHRLIGSENHTVLQWKQNHFYEFCPPICTKIYHASQSITND